MTKMTLSEELTWRGFANQTTLVDIADVDKTSRVFYLGVDPSAQSMTIGNLAVMMMVRLFAAHGHKAILLVGGATGMIGDPDGKKQERDLLTLEQVDTNKKALAAQYKQVLGEIPFDLVDNYDWFKGMGYLQFLREVGKHVPMRQMLGREFVQSRLGEDGAGISYAEFSYSLIQGYDFVHLYREKGCTLQICGADQWGNSIAGVDLLRRMDGVEAHVWSAPLVMNKTTGVKFGKTEDGALWLDPTLTSTYKFYQFWLNVDDAGVEEYLKIYTLLPKEEIEALMAEFAADRASRKAQKALAYEVTKIVHGQDNANRIVRITDVLFGDTPFEDLDESEITLLKEEIPAVPAQEDAFQTLVDAGLAGSKTEARNFVGSGAISVNGQKISADQPVQLRSGPNLVKRGKNSFALVINNK